MRIHWLIAGNNKNNCNDVDDDGCGCGGDGDENGDVVEVNESARDEPRRTSAWDRLQPLVSDEDLNVDRNLKTWMSSERMRTSSPELCRRSALPTVAD